MNTRGSVTAIFAILIAILSLATGAYVVKEKSNMSPVVTPASPVAPNPEKKNNKETNSVGNILLMQIRTEADAANYCSVSSDCKSENLIHACFSLVNKNADLSKIRELQEKYFKLGLQHPLAAMDCAPNPSPSELRCAARKCTVAR